MNHTATYPPKSPRPAMGGYRYFFNGQESDGEVYGSGILAGYEFRQYDTRLGRWWGVDTKNNETPGVSPYSFALNSPTIFIDADGNFPILPFLLKAGAAGAADMLMQATFLYFFDPQVESVGEAFSKVNWWQVARSSLEGLVPCKTPGGKLGRAAATAAGDVFVNALNNRSDYSAEEALMDFAIGFLGDLVGGEIGDVVNKYGSKAVANGLLRMGFDTKYIRQVTGGLSNKEVRMWYSEQVKSINTNIAPTEANAKMIVEKRNQFKRQARELMSDRNKANELDKNYPIREFDYYKEKYSKMGYSGEDLYKRIMEGGSTPNSTVNEKYGVK